MLASDQAWLIATTARLRAAETRLNQAAAALEPEPRPAKP